MALIIRVIRILIDNIDIVLVVIRNGHKLVVDCRGDITHPLRREHYSIVDIQVPVIDGIDSLGRNSDIGAGEGLNRITGDIEYQVGKPDKVHDVLDFWFIEV